MKLVSPRGVNVSVSDEKGERLKKQGWKEPQSETAEAPASPAPKRRGRPKKVETDTDE